MEIENAFNGWNQTDAELLRTDVRKRKYDPVNVAEALSRAQEALGIEAHQKDAYVVPLFAEHEPMPTNEYVFYRPERETVGWFDTGSLGGVERFADCEKLNDTVIGHRLRFWLSDSQEEVSIALNESELPEDRISPANRLSDAQQEEFFGQLRDFVDYERQAEVKTNWERYTDLGLETAIRRNRVSGPFVYVSRDGSAGAGAAYNYLLATEEDDDKRTGDLRDDEGLFQGNHCLLDVEGGGSTFPIEVELLSVDDPSVKIQPNWQKVGNRDAVHKLLDGEDSEVWLYHLLNPVPFDRRIRAIRQVEGHRDKRDLLTGQRDVGFSVNKFALPDSEIELNDSQWQALVWAVGAEDVVCIHGPPGTGKTRTLTAYVEEAVSRGQSVLVTAHSNQAVDNLLVGDSSRHSPEEDTLHALVQDPDRDFSITRVGSNSRNHVVADNYVNRPISGADVVAATTSGAAQFDQNEFDVAVVDEATQASRPATSIVLNCAEKLVLAGDHKQLPPYCADETMQEEDLHISLFEYLLERYDDEISVLLRTQYRMNDEIAQFPNEAFYDGNLETADRNRDWTIEDMRPLQGIHISGDERRESHGNSYYNQREAETVAKQVKLLVEVGVPPEDIGVITAYSGQTGKIVGQIHNLDIGNPGRITVDTVDSFQGGEREAIVVSFVRSNDEGYSGFLEFPEEGPRRLNVALTRARKRLVLIGDWETLGARAPHRSPEESCAHYYAELAESLRSRGLMLS